MCWWRSWPLPCSARSRTCSSAAEPMIELRDATVTVRSDGGVRTLLQLTTCTLTERRVAVIGANGSGKSTLARLVNGLVLPSTGTVRVDGLDTARDGAAVRRLVGFVFTDPDAQRECDVLDGRWHHQLRIRIGEDETHQTAHGSPVPRGVKAVYPDGAGRRQHQAVDQAREGRLAGPVGPDHGHAPLGEGAGGELQERADPAVGADGDSGVAQLDHRLSGARACPGTRGTRQRPRPPPAHS